MLLRALEEKRFLPLGGDREVSSDFQLIAGTNRNLTDAVKEGRFRDDLLARLNAASHVTIFPIAPVPIEPLELQEILPVPITLETPCRSGLGVTTPMFGMPPAILWRMLSPQHRVLTCEVRAGETGLLLHIAYGDELVWSQHFQGPAARADLEMRAEAWRTALIEEGFTPGSRAEARPGLPATWRLLRG